MYRPHRAVMLAVQVGNVGSGCRSRISAGLLIWVDLPARGVGLVDHDRAVGES